MDKPHMLSTQMIVISLDMERDPFIARENEEELLDSEVAYLSVNGALMYVVNYICPDILFNVNLLAIYSSLQTQRHWNIVKQILHYLMDAMDMNLFYSKVCKLELTSYTNAYYISKLYNGSSETSYQFTCDDTSISWRYAKQIVETTS